jgi:predicted Zn-dependent protease
MPTLLRPLTVRLTACTALVAIAVACATNPVTGRREVTLMSESQEIAIGQQVDVDIRREMGVYDDPELQRYVADLGRRLAAVSHRPGLPWTFTVVDNAAINAFAAPGGYIYLTRGILAYMQDEAELVGVLGHEIGHVTARHAAQQYTRATGGTLGLIALGIFVPGARPFGDLASTGLGLLFLRYGREDELQSDRLGAEYAVAAGWDPHGVPRFLQTLSRVSEMSERGVPNWLSTHPEPGSRVEVARPIAEQLAAGRELTRNRDGYERRIDGIIFGDNPRDGIVRGRAFLHPELRFALEFPDGWEVRNSPQQVVAREPGEDHYMLLQIVQQPRGRDITEIAVNHMSGSGFTRVSGERTRISGLDAHLGVYRGSLQGLGRVLMRAGHIVMPDRTVYVLAGFAPEARYDRIQPVVTASIRSFRELSRAEAAGIRPNRIDFYTVREGDTWQSIAQRASQGIVQATTLAIMNGSEVNVQPRTGARIRIVVEG